MNAFSILAVQSVPAATIATIDADMLDRARDAGFGAVLWRFAGSAFDTIDPGATRGAAGLTAMLGLDPARFPIDHPLVSAHPAAFALRRTGAEDATIDPRRPLPPRGYAVARLADPAVATLLTDAIATRLVALAADGIAGFVLDARAAPKVIADLAAKVSAKSDAVVLLELADTTGSLDGPVDGVGAVVIHANGEAPSGIEVPVLLDAAQAAAYGDPAASACRLAAIGALSDGLVLPLALLHSGAGVAAARRAIANAERSRAYRGERRLLTRPGARVSATLRADAADVRNAGSALLILANGSDGEAAAPAGIWEAAGAAFSPDGDVRTPLAAGEVRLVPLTRAQPIVAKAPVATAERGAEWPRLVVEALSPAVAGGDFAVKRVVGERVAVEATIYTDGHEQLGAELQWRAADTSAWQAVRMEPAGNDAWQASFVLERLGAYEYAVEGWLDRYGGFRRDFQKKRDAGVALAVDHAEGRLLIEEAIERAAPDVRATLQKRLAAIDAEGEADAQAALLLDEGLAAAMDAADDRPHRLRSAVQRVDAERLQARFSSWYELFPRSMTDDKGRHGTFGDVIEHLPRMRAMGFDALYFPPIHPIGKTNRKGPNNTLTPEPHDVGSPYAIGGAAGGHDAIHPELGTFEDFDRLVAAAADHGLEIALDFAIQASPDHPWLNEHPGWFAWRPDGSMKYAENPPKKYQDIVNVDFYGPDAVPGLWRGLRDVILLWIEHGVKTFRVDNPHTKPLPFWEWMIRDVRAKHPDAIFLAEAFTRPTMMYRLAKVGFSQSYTYFTWRDGKHELIDYITELTTTAPKEFYRPHFFVNTPDINPHFLQTSGRPGFRIRAVLAATLSGLFGVYSGFELCEAAALPGKEEYLDSEKYEIRTRDYAAPGNIVADISLLNRLRRAHPALQTHLNTRFYAAHDDNILWYAKPEPEGTGMVMVMVNLDPHQAHECDFEVPLWEFGLGDQDSVAVEDLAAGHRFRWYGKTQHIRLDPSEPYRIWRIAPGEGA